MIDIYWCKTIRFTRYPKRTHFRL